MTTFPFEELKQKILGELHFDAISKTIYATDASDFKEIPLGVCFPTSEEDLIQVVLFAQKYKLPLIPRAAGTSLAGQVVGKGLVVDVSRLMNKIIAIHPDEKWALVEPGVVRDELNMQTRNLGLFFAPETSTANRATIGGMVGNNSCGSNSIVYGSTREHVLAIRAVLSDGSVATFENLSPASLAQKCEQKNLEGSIYQQMLDLLGEPSVAVEIEKEFPKKSIKRRNTGYALDQLLALNPFEKQGEAFNFCKLLCGSEGTLCFITQIKVQLLPLPPSENALVCIHCSSVNEAMLANIECVGFHPYSLELIDHYIIDCTRQQIAYQHYLFFVQGSPKAILIAELRADTKEVLAEKIKDLTSHLAYKKMGYHYAIVHKESVQQVWQLRKAGLGLLANLPGDEKAVAVIEDTAVEIHDLPAYIQEFNDLLAKYQLYAVHYAHIGTGELHLRPLLNLKTSHGQKLYRILATEIAQLVKKYKGSLSGEHGDGRLRGEFMEYMVGPKNYLLLIQTKAIWDTHNILNPNKIVHTPKMDESLRFEPDYPYPVHKTYFRYAQGDILRDAQQCNGSGDCRKSHLSGGTMCPSFMATKNEKDTTRARANVLREALSEQDSMKAFSSEEAYQILDLCLSCKGCKSECPSNVDMAKMKAEFLQHYYEHHRMSLRNKLTAYFPQTMSLMRPLSFVYNFVQQAPILSTFTKKIIGFHPKRSLPILQATSLQSWYQAYKKDQLTHKPPYHAKVYLFCDEFTNYLDVSIGQKTILLLERLGYEVMLPPHIESGRTFLSKGLVKKAKEIANYNVSTLSKLITSDTPLIGIEPSALLTFRDEYPDLVDEELLIESKALARHTFLIDEFLVHAFEAGHIQKNQFTHTPKQILLHGHCQQKAIASVHTTERMLQITGNHVQVIPSGCCGMAGSFGYEKEHYELSMQVGELVLFPAIRKAKNTTTLVAYGTSCRHQIKDGTKRYAEHPVEVLFEQLA